MLPKTRAGEDVHRRRKRQIEIGIIVEKIAEHLARRSDAPAEHTTVLEFGSGDGTQARFLRRIGHVVASDTYVSGGVWSGSGIAFVQCSITAAPFVDGRFDVVFSHHVLEHIDDLDAAWPELLRIGKPSCVYAFSVPTSVWLLLAIPAQYYNKLRRIRDRMGVADESLGSALRGLWTGARPHGHGVVHDFLACYRAFKIGNWRRLLSSHGFSIVEEVPLLLYGPSEFPVVPTSRPRFGLCSSVLFLMTRSRATSSGPPA